jgi:hypothetical protein
MTGVFNRIEFLYHTLSQDFVVHSLRHTMLIRLGEAGADAFTIMKIAGHSSVTLSQRYVHPTPEGVERAFQRLQSLNAAKHAQAKAETALEATDGRSVPAKVATSKSSQAYKTAQVIGFNGTGP